MSRYAKSNDGFVHLVSALGNEYTLCGDAYEGSTASDCGKDPFSDIAQPTAWEFCDSGPVTCMNCCREIMNCRGVKIKSKT